MAHHILGLPDAEFYRGSRPLMSRVHETSGIFRVAKNHIQNIKVVLGRVQKLVRTELPFAESVSPHSESMLTVFTVLPVVQKRAHKQQG